MSTRDMFMTISWIKLSVDRAQKWGHSVLKCNLLGKWVFSVSFCSLILFCLQICLFSGSFCCDPSLCSQRPFTEIHYPVIFQHIAIFLVNNSKKGNVHGSHSVTLLFDFSDGITACNIYISLMLHRHFKLVSCFAFRVTLFHSLWIHLMKSIILHLDMDIMLCCVETCTWVTYQLLCFASVSMSSVLAVMWLCHHCANFIWVVNVRVM